MTRQEVQASVKWVVGIATGIITLVSFAFVVGANVASSKYEVIRVEGKVDTNCDHIVEINKKVDDHIDISCKDIKSIQRDVNNMMTIQAVQAETLNKQAETLDKIERKIE